MMRPIALFSLTPFVLSLLALSLWQPDANAAEGGADLSGAWVAWVCPPNTSQPGLAKCANLVLELHQKGGKLCGAHVYASPGATRMDEGAAPSLVGEVVDGATTATVASGRSAVRVRVELKQVNGSLQWQRLENPSGDYLLPMSARLTRAKSKSLFAPIFEHELKAACLMIFNAAAASDPPGTTPPAAAQMPETK